MKHLDILRTLAQRPLPLVLAAPVVRSGEDEVRRFFDSLEDGESAIPDVARLVRDYPESGYPYYWLAGLVRDYDMGLALRFMELASSFEARAIGCARFQEDRDFFEDLSTRHFLECLFLQALYSFEVKSYDVARFLFERCLFLCPTDNLGARFFLPGMYLHAGDKKAFKILERAYRHTIFLESDIVAMAFAVEAGKIKLAMDHLGSAIYVNKFIAPLLIGAMACRDDTGVDGVMHAFDCLSRMRAAAGKLGRIIDIVTALVPESVCDFAPGSVCYFELRPAGGKVGDEWLEWSEPIQSLWKTKG